MIRKANDSIKRFGKWLGGLAPLRTVPGFAGIALVSYAFYYRFGVAVGLFVLGLFMLRLDSRL